MGHRDSPQRGQHTRTDASRQALRARDTIPAAAEIIVGRAAGETPAETGPPAGIAAGPVRGPMLAWCKRSPHPSAIASSVRVPNGSELGRRSHRVHSVRLRAAQDDQLREYPSGRGVSTRPARTTPSKTRRTGATKLQIRSSGACARSSARVGRKVLRTFCPARRARRTPLHATLRAAQSPGQEASKACSAVVLSSRCGPQLPTPAWGLLRPKTTPPRPGEPRGARLCAPIAS